MTDTASISGHLHFIGRTFPAAPPGRPGPAESAGAQRSQRPVLPEPAAPSNGTSAPQLLNGSTQIAAQTASQGTPQDTGQNGEQPGQPSNKAAGTDPSNPENLSEEEKQKVQELQQTDREVRAHEQAHKAAGGALAGNPTYKTVRGPDGRSYAVSGEVKIDTSPVPNNPDATIRKMEQVKRAALAPSNPSSQDRRVAAETEAKIQKARQEKREEDAEALEKANAKSGSQAADPLDASNPGNPLKPAPLNGQEQAGVIRPSGNTASLNPGSLFNLVA